MKQFRFVLWIFWLTACSSLPPAIENPPSVDISYQQALNNQSAYNNAPVRWGGVVVDLKNEQEFSTLQVLSYPLYSNGRPMVDKPYFGRFVINSREFLDPSVYTKNKKVTVAGTLKGDSEQTIGNKKLRLPLVESTLIYLWPDFDSGDYYGPYGSYPYYWGGYYGYSPYFWGGFYRPYPRW